MKTLNRWEREEYATKFTLIGIFLSAFAGFVSRKGFWRRKAEEDAAISGMDLILLGLSTMRLGRMISYDLVAEPLRRPFAVTVPDPTGAGDTVEPREQSGVRRSLGQLVACPICAGTWVSAALVYGLKSVPGVTRIFMAILGVTGLAEVLNALVEYWSWSGQLARVRAGDELDEP